VGQLALGGLVAMQENLPSARTAQPACAHGRCLVGQSVSMLPLAIPVLSVLPSMQVVEGTTVDDAVNIMNEAHANGLALVAECAQVRLCLCVLVCAGL
jgi:hypothetical protein